MEREKGREFLSEREGGRVLPPGREREGGRPRERGREGDG